MLGCSWLIFIFTTESTANLPTPATSTQFLLPAGVLTPVRLLLPVRASTSTRLILPAGASTTEAASVASQFINDVDNVESMKMEVDPFPLNEEDDDLSGQQLEVNSSSNSASETNSSDGNDASTFINSCSPHFIMRS